MRPTNESPLRASSHDETGGEGENGTPLPADGPAAPDGRALDPAEVVGRFVERFGGRYIAIADGRIRRLGLNATIFSGEDAVGAAAAALLTALIDGRLKGPFLAIEDVRGPFESQLRDRIAGQRRSQRAGKRGDSRNRVPISGLSDTPGSWQPPDARMPPADQSLVVEEAVHRLRASSRRDGDRLACALLLRLDGASHRDIADELGLEDVASVERLFHRIRAILGPWLKPPV